MEKVCDPKWPKRWKANQCGYKADHRTEDNIFILKTIYESYVENKQQKVYAAFVDFSKFFDKINRKYLFYKLLKYGITGNVYKIIKSMYDKPKYSVMIDGQISPAFTSHYGVKQGCSMSPILSNIFQNDLHDIFQDCDPVEIGGTHFNSISWADDLLLLSHSSEGLQSCLNKLQAYCNQWGLVINVAKTKSMVFTKNNWAPLTLTIGTTRVECVKHFQYLGFNLSYNMNFKHTISDRLAKALKMANMVQRALHTSHNTSAKLSLSLFDKQISPILLYGSAIWGVPDNHNFLYLNDQPEGGNTRRIVENALRTTCGFDVPIRNTRRVGKRTNGTCRRILIQLQNVQDKEIIFRNANSFSFSMFCNNSLTQVDKFQSDFCKRSLNISKYASNLAVLGELGRFPLNNTVWATCIKYWVRLHGGTRNELLNAAFRTAWEENHNWLQGIFHILTCNGFRYIWDHPPSSDSNFHVIYKRSLNDQYIQIWRSKLIESKRFTLLDKIKPTFSRSSYIDKIRNPEIRLVFTRLRIDLNVFSSYYTRENNSTSCPICQQPYDSILHLLFHCPYFDADRTALYNILLPVCPNWGDMDDASKLLYLIDTKCPDTVIKYCCSYIYKLYKHRERLRT